MPRKVRLVGFAYLYRALERRHGFPVHESTVRSYIDRKGFPKEFYSPAEKEAQGLGSMRLWEQHMVDAYLDHIHIEPRPRDADPRPLDEQLDEVADSILEAHRRMYAE